MTAIYRIPITDEQAQAVLEAAQGADEEFIKNGLISIVLSWKHSKEHDLQWRMEDE